MAGQSRKELSAPRSNRMSLANRLVSWALAPLKSIFCKLGTADAERMINLGRGVASCMNSSNP